MSEDDDVTAAKLAVIAELTAFVDEGISEVGAQAIMDFSHYESVNWLSVDEKAKSIFSSLVRHLQETK